MSKVSRVVVISGPPAAGKTTLARYLSKELELPILAKDTIKESLLDTLGSGDRQRSVEIGFAAFQLHLALAKELVESGTDFIYETAFYSKSTKDIKHALAGAEIVQGWMHADIDRMLQRARTRERHPGHADWYEGYEKECRDKGAQGVYDALDIGGVCVAIESNDFDSHDYKNAVDELVEHYRI